MKRFLLFILIGAALFFIIDKAFVVFLLHSPKVQADKRLEKMIQGKINKDIIIMGSSRGARNVLAGEIEKKTGRSCYNLSYPGSDVVFHEFLLKTLLKFNEKPQQLILVVDVPYELWQNDWLVFRNDRLYPLTKYPYIMEELIKRGEKNRFLSRFFVLHRLGQSSFRIRNIPFTALDSISSNGSMPVSFKDPDIEFEFYSDSLDYDVSMEVPEKVESFRNIDSICRSNDIELLLVFPPNFSVFNEEHKERMLELAPDAREYVYNKQQPAYRDAAYFFDDGHLTLEGARIFTNELIGFIK